MNDYLNTSQHNIMEFVSIPGQGVGSGSGISGISVVSVVVSFSTVAVVASSLSPILSSLNSLGWKMEDLFYASHNVSYNADIHKNV